MARQSVAKPRAQRRRKVVATQAEEGAVLTDGESLIEKETPAEAAKPMELKAGGAEKSGDQVAVWFTSDLQKAKWMQLLNSENEQVVIRAMTYLCDRLYDKAQGGAAGKDAAVLELVVRHIGRA